MHATMIGRAFFRLFTLMGHTQLLGWFVASRGTHHPAIHVAASVAAQPWNDGRGHELRLVHFTVSLAAICLWQRLTFSGRRNVDLRHNLSLSPADQNLTRIMGREGSRSVAGEGVLLRRAVHHDRGSMTLYLPSYLGVFRSSFMPALKPARLFETASFNSRDTSPAPPSSSLFRSPPAAMSSATYAFSVPAGVQLIAFERWVLVLRYTCTAA